MAYQWSFSPQFAFEFSNFTKDISEKVLDFLDIYDVHGLGDFTQYPGKIAPSWRGLSTTDPNYAFTFNNDLWHYHVGHPLYTQSPFGNYSTSDWLLHFQWKNRGNDIVVVDVYSHYTSGGAFYLPPQSSLD